MCDWSPKKIEWRAGNIGKNSGWEVWNNGRHELQEAECTWRRLNKNLKKSLPTHFVVKLKNTKDKEKPLKTARENK